MCLGSSTTGILSTLYKEQSDDVISDSKDKCHISENPIVWTYRKPASIVHFKQAYQRHLEIYPSGERKFTVLTMFLEQVLKDINSIILIIIF